MVASVEERVLAVRGWSNRHSRPLAALALAIFVVLCALAFSRYLGLHLHPRLWLLLPTAAVAAPLMAGLNAAEYACGARLAGHRPSGREAVTVSVGGSIANSLPIPGAVIVRNYAMVSGGASVSAAIGSTITMAVAWISVTAVVVGAIVATANPTLGAPVAILGLVMLAVSGSFVRRRVAPRRVHNILAALVLVELATVTLDIGRYWLVLAALGAHPTVMRTMPLVSANVIAAAMVTFPGGLGGREALAAAFSTVAHVPPAIGIAASALDRVALTVGFLALAAVLAFDARMRGNGEPQDPPAIGAADALSP
jgi:uncharacterized membrane protein YbhN (UPF0104 family)